MDKRTLATALLILTLTISSMMAVASPAAAHSPPQSIPTTTRISIKPNPVGVEQTVNMSIWVEPPPATATSQGGDRWQGLRINITRPDGKTEVKGPFTSDANGSLYVFYTPVQTGTYVFSAIFPGQMLRLYNPINGSTGVPSEYINDTFLPSFGTTSLTVQPDQVSSPLPTPTPSTSQISGYIQQSVTWTRSNNPYTFVGDANVWLGATLTIEPGVMVNLNGHTLLVNGQIVANGTASQRIIFNGGTNDVGVEVVGLGGSVIQNCEIHGLIKANGPTTIQYNTVYGRISIVNGTSQVVHGNTVYGADGADGIGFGDGFWQASAIISDNTVSGAWRGIDVPSGCAASIVRNYVHNCTWGIVVGSTNAYGYITGAAASIMNNTVENCVGGVILIGAIAPEALISNNFLGNKEFALSLAGTSSDSAAIYCSVDVNAFYNWWETINPQEIAQKVLDKRVNPAAGNATFLPCAPYKSEQSMPDFSFTYLPPPPAIPQNSTNPSPTPIPSEPPYASPTPGATPPPESRLDFTCQASTSSSSLRVTIDGTLTTATEGKGIASVPVLLAYSVTNGETWTDLTAVTSDGNGHFAALWLPSVTGNFLVRATWNGNSTLGGSSTINNLAITPYQEGQSYFSVTSNSTLSSFLFDSEREVLSFTVTGATDTAGYVDLYVPKSLIANATDLQVNVDGKPLTFTSVEQSDCWLISFTYHHSTHGVTVNMGTLASTQTQNSGDGNPWILVGAVLTAVVVAAVVVIVGLRRRRPRSSAFANEA
jgi:hypothetical protein